MLFVALMLGLLLAVLGRISPRQAKQSEPVYLPITLRESSSQAAIILTPTPSSTLVEEPDSTSTPTPVRTEDPESTPIPTSTPSFTPTHTPTPSFTPTSESTSVSSAAIVVDHTDTDVSVIPDYWIEQAKKFIVHYAHTSHGNQVLVGLEWLERSDPKYNVDFAWSGPVILPDDPTALGFYDGNNYPDDTAITPEMYWESEDGVAHTRSVADTGWFDFSLWTWCGQASAYYPSQIQTYLDVMAQLEIEYPGMRFIYYTGHSDGSAPGSTLWQNNDMIRQYVQANQKVLFDFNDMEVYAPDGSGPYNNDGDGYCEWCEAWCSAHPTAFECQSVPNNCDHTHGLACTLKGQAFWVLIARLAGWDGTPAP